MQSSEERAIDALPFEVLSQIMSFVVSGQTLVYDQHALPSFSLALVCLRWREIALATPSLWNVVFCDYSNSHGHGFWRPDGAEMVEEYIRRAGNLPLFIIAEFSKKTITTADSHRPPYGHLPPFNHPVLAVLAQYSHRWQQAILRIIPCALGSQGAFGHLSLVNLRAVWFLNDRSDIVSRTSYSPFTQPTALDNAPNLVCATVNGGLLLPVSKWMGLQTLIINGWISPSVWNMLSRWRMPGIPTLELQNAFSDDYTLQFRPVDLIKLPGCKTLRILRLQDSVQTNKKAVLASLLENLGFPDLEALEIDMWPNPTTADSVRYWPMAKFCSFLRSCSNLTSLQLKFFDVRWMEIMRLLHCTPNLTTLYLEPDARHSNEKAVTQSLLEALTWDPQITFNKPLQYLRSFRFGMRRDCSFDALSALLQLCSSRRITESGAVLNDVHVFFLVEKGQGRDSNNKRLMNPLLEHEELHAQMKVLRRHGLKMYCRLAWH